MKAEKVEELLRSSCLPLQQLGWSLHRQCPNKNWGLQEKSCPFFLKKGGFANADGASFKEEMLVEGRAVPGEPLDAAFGRAKAV